MSASVFVCVCGAVELDSSLLCVLSAGVNQVNRLRDEICNIADILI